MSGLSAVSVATESAAASLAAPTALFQGHNSVLGSGLSIAVEGHFSNTGASSNVICSVCTTAEELAQSLSIDQSLSVGFGPAGGVDEKVEFMNSLKVTTYSVSVTVYASHGTGTQNVTDVKFKAGIAVPTDNATANQFVRYYGDSFVAAVGSGGEYMAVYTFYSQTREDQSSLKTNLKANGIFDGVTVGGSLQTAMDNFLKTTTVNYAFRQKVTGILNPVLPMPSNFVDYAVKFPSVPIDAPVVISIGSRGYEDVPGAGTGFDRVRQNRAYFIGGEGFDTGLTGKLTAIVQAANQMKWISALYTYYGGFSDPTLSTNTVTAANDIAAILGQMSDFATDATASFPVLPLPSLANGTPQLSYSVGEGPYWGGDGGGPFDDVDLSTYLQHKIRISAIGLRTGSRTDQLRGTYLDGDGAFTTKVHGGGGGSDRGTLQLLEGQFVTKVVGRSGSRLDQVNFYISDGRSIGGEGNGGSPYTWTPPPGAFVTGFKGRSGSEIDGLQIEYAAFLPAKWTPITG